MTHLRLGLLLIGLFLAACVSAAYAESGIASVYSGGGTASGERQDSGALTAAHRTLPFGTWSGHQQEQRSLYHRPHQ